MSKFQQQLKEFQAMRNRILGNEDVCVNTFITKRCFIIDFIRILTDPCFGWQVIRSSLARIGDIVEKSARTTLGMFKFCYMILAGVSKLIAWNVNVLSIPWQILLMDR